MNDVLVFISQKEQEIGDLCHKRHPSLPTPLKIAASKTHHRPSNRLPQQDLIQPYQTQSQSRPESISPATSEDSRLKNASSTVGLRGIFSKKNNRLSSESSSLGSSPSSAKSEAFIQNIKLNNLGTPETNVTLSADAMLFLFWNKDHLEVHNDKGYKRSVPDLVKNPVLVAASTNCCAVVGRAEPHDKVRPNAPD